MSSSPSILDQIEDEADKAQFIHDMNRLMSHRGWKRISKWLSEKVEFYQEQLNSGDDIKTMEDVRVVRLKRNISEQLINIPEILIDIVSSNSEDDDNLDPFE